MPHPFGMPINRLTRNARDYRFGFNGQEKSTDVSFGHTTAEFWEYDSRIGRRWNVDPVVKSYISGYATFGNNPILYSDVKGDDWYMNSNNKAQWDNRRGDYLDENGVEHKSLGLTISYNVLQGLDGEADILGDPSPGGTKFETNFSITGNYNSKSEFTGFTYTLNRTNHSCYADQGLSDPIGYLLRGQESYGDFGNFPELKYNTWFSGKSGDIFTSNNSLDYNGILNSGGSFTYVQSTSTAVVSVSIMELYGAYSREADPLVYNGLKVTLNKCNELNVSVIHSDFMNTQVHMKANESFWSSIYQYQTPSYLLTHNPNLFNFKALDFSKYKLMAFKAQTRYGNLNKLYSRTNQIKRIKK